MSEKINFFFHSRLWASEAARRQLMASVHHNFFGTLRRRNASVCIERVLRHENYVKYIWQEVFFCFGKTPEFFSTH